MLLLAYGCPGGGLGDLLARFSWPLFDRPVMASAVFLPWLVPDVVVLLVALLRLAPVLLYLNLVAGSFLKFCAASMAWAPFELMLSSSLEIWSRLASVVCRCSTASRPGLPTMLLIFFCRSTWTPRHLDARAPKNLGAPLPVTSDQGQFLI